MYIDASDAEANTNFVMGPIDKTAILSKRVESLMNSGSTTPATDPGMYQHYATADDACGECGHTFMDLVPECTCCSPV